MFHTCFVSASPNWGMIRFWLRFWYLDFWQLSGSITQQIHEITWCREFLSEHWLHSSHKTLVFNMSMFLPRMNAPCFSIRGFPIFVAIGITFLRYCSSPQKLERRWNMQGWMLLLYLISMCICACLTVIYFATRKILDIPSRMDLLMGLLWFNNHWFPYNFP